MKLKKIHRQEIVVVGVALLFVVSIMLYLRPKQVIAPESINNFSQEMKEYKSDFLDFSVSFPSKFQVEEDMTFVNFISSEGIINVSRNGTDFYDIQSYLQDFDLKRNIQVTSEDGENIQGINGVRRIEKFNSGPTERHLAMYFYINNSIYAISTSSEELYDELDQIAQSFRYTPN